MCFCSFNQSSHVRWIWARWGEGWDLGGHKVGTKHLEARLHRRDKCCESSLCQEHRLREEGTRNQHLSGEDEEKDSKVVPEIQGEHGQPALEPRPCRLIVQGLPLLEGPESGQGEVPRQGLQG